MKAAHPLALPPLGPLRPTHKQLIAFDMLTAPWTLGVYPETEWHDSFDRETLRTTAQCRVPISNVKSS